MNAPGNPVGAGALLLTNPTTCRPSRRAPSHRGVTAVEGDIFPRRATMTAIKKTVRGFSLVQAISGKESAASSLVRAHCRP